MLAQRQKYNLNVAIYKMLRYFHVTYHGEGFGRAGTFWTLLSVSEVASKSSSDGALSSLAISENMID